MNIKWLKLDTEILDHHKIKLIRKHPGGSDIIVLWIGLLCIGMKSNEPGIIQIADGLPYSTDDLSTLFDIEKKTVELGITLFLKYGMIQATEGGLIEIVNFREHQSIDKIEYEREKTRLKVAKFRQKKRLLAIETDDVTVTGVTGNEQTREDKTRSDKNREDQIIQDETFNVFWNTYDKKMDRHKCFSKWKKLTLEEKEIILTYLPSYVEATPEKQYRKHPATFLNNRAWENEIVTKVQVTKQERIQQTLEAKYAEDGTK